MDKKFGVFLDIDGCLTSNDGNVCLEHYMANAAISELVKDGFVGRGPSVHLCSGRDINVVEIVAHFFGIKNNWMIAECGALLFNPTTRATKLNPAITPEVIKFFQGLEHKEIRTILKRFANLQKYLGYKVCYSLERVCGSGGADMDLVEKFIKGEKLPWKKNHKGSWIYRRKSGLLTSAIKKRLLQVDRHMDRCIDIVPPGVDKGSAAKYLAQLSGIDLLYSIAVGDSELDFPLFHYCERIGCPSNATPGCKEFVKSRRGVVSMLPYTQGVMDVINFWLSKRE